MTDKFNAIALWVAALFTVFTPMAFLYDLQVRLAFSSCPSWDWDHGAHFSGMPIALPCYTLSRALCRLRGARCAFLLHAANTNSIASLHGVFVLDRKSVV